jgi:glycosyltransferase involved in cell wall biosynthesis
MTTIGLCMIVKNESKVITRCLDSVLPLVDYVMIEDTGSTDGTQQLITGWLERAAMPGMVIEEPWRDFAYNRSHVLVKLRELEQIDYALIIDADDLLVLPKDFDLAAFKAGMRDDLCMMCKSATAGLASIARKYAPTSCRSASRPCCMSIWKPRRACFRAAAPRGFISRPAEAAPETRIRPSIRTMPRCSPRLS